MEHPHADILRAIADGKEIEYKYVSLNKNQPWENCNKERIFEILAHKVECDYEFRIKPEVKTKSIILWKNGAIEENTDPGELWSDKVKAEVEAIIQVSYTPGEGL